MALNQGDVQGGLKKGNAPAQPPPQKPIVLHRSGTVVPASQPQQPVDEPPHPVLQQHGFNGGIQQFNQRVQAVNDNYQASYGQPPTPGLTLDLAKSPLNVGDFSKLFSVPKDPMAARARGVVNSIPPRSQLVVRHDGLVEQNNPVAARLIANEKTSTPDVSGLVAPSRSMAQYQALQKQHPWVAMGMLPIGNNDVAKFWDAVSYAQSHPGAAQPLKVGGETLQQYQQENILGESLVGGRPGENPGLATSQGYGQPAKPNDMTAILRGRQGVAQGVTTVKSAQDALKQVAPDYFGNLPSSGFINQDWAKVLGQYQTSPQYFRQQTVQLAKDNHFGSNTSAFIAAWKTKQNLIKKQPFLANFLAHQPLALFDVRTRGAAIMNLLTGNTKGWGWTNIPTVGLNVLTNTAGLVFNEAAGTVDQAKIDASYVTAYMQAIMPKNVAIPGTPLAGEGLTEQQAREKAAKVLFEKPTWARVIDPNLGTKQDWIPFSRQAAPIFNAAVDLWIGSAKFTGEQVAAGDIAAASSSRYLQNKSAFAFNSLEKGDLGGAVASLEGGRGAEDLAAALEKGVKDGSVSQQQFQQHVSELYAHGHTTIGEDTINGPLLRSLRTKDLPTPGRVGTAASKAHQVVKGVLDNFENSLRARKQVGATSHAADLIASVRQQFARAAPENERRAIFDTRTPEDVYNWAKVNLKDQKLAAGLRDDFIRLRAQNDVQGVTDLNDKMRALYAKAHPDSEIARTPLEPTQGPEIESESRTYLMFPKSIETRAQRINAALNKAGRAHREIIVGGSPNPIPILPMVPGFGESLMYKHAIADTARRVAGGGGVFGITGELKGVKAAVEDYAKEDPQALRQLGVNRDAAVAGENRYITGQKPTDSVNFNTGEKVNLATNRPLETKAAQEAAGGYLRRLISSRALKAYQASTADNLGPMIDLVQNDKELQSLLYKDARTFTPSTEYQRIPDGLELPTGGEIAVRGNVRYIRWPAEAVPKPIRFGGMTATEAAEALFKRYKDVEEAGFKQGLVDPLGDAQQLLIKSLGPSADKKLGRWIDENQLNFPVRDGLVPRKQFDDVMQAWIGKLMTANKWNRGQIYDHVLYSTVNDLTKAGWDMKDAIPVATDLAKAQTVYHMLDFSNMLQVEQNLRWLSYFATKHRLYWKWVLGQAARRPGLDALVGDVHDHLDKYGNLQLPLSIAGYKLAIPAARLFWANATEYPQTSPIVQGAFEAGKGIAEGHGPAGAVNDALGSLTSTSGNLVTRDDQAELWAIKLAGVTSGKIPATADAVKLGLSPSQQQQFFHAVNEYSAFYKAKHGDWPTEQDAVKHVLVGQTASTFWNTNLFLPVTVTRADQKVSGNVQKLLAQYGHIINPVKKREFLDQHPEVALHFGVNQDPSVFLHNNKLWDQFNAAQNALSNARQQIYQGILKNGQVTAVELENESKLSSEWAKTINKLQLEDATWAGNSQFPAGKVSDNQVVNPGPWGKALEGDPYAARAFLHQVFPNIPQSKLNSHTVGETVVQLQAESRRLSLVKNNLAAATKLGYPDLQHVKDRLSQISQILAPFYAYPKDAPGKLEDEYYNKYVSPYIQQRKAKTNAIALAPEDQQDALRSELRAWKDSHDHPVYVTMDGKRIKFPSVVQIGWARLPGPTRHQALAQAVTGDWSHIASYEKTLLGVKTSAGVSQGWAAYYDAVGQYNKTPGNASLVAAQKTDLARQINKVYPGFYQDYLFAQKPKVERYERTTLYQQMPKAQKSQFDQYIGGPAKQLSATIKKDGNRNFYEKQWRNYVETQVVPWLNGQPGLRNELALYGPNFLNTLVSTSG